MKWQSLMFGVATAAGAMFLTASVLSQDKPELEAPPADEQQTMIERFMAHATPGDHHARLAAMVGTWEMRVEHWSHPEAEPTPAKLTSTYEWIMDGRFIRGTHKGRVMGMPFEGMDIIGYDNTREQYVTMWIDSMSTSLLTLRGTYKEDDKTIETIGTHNEIATGRRDVRLRHVTRLGDGDGEGFINEMYAVGPDGEEYIVMRGEARPAP